METAITYEQRAAIYRKQINVRRAHRASANKIINRIDTVIASGDTRRLRQLKQSLIDKWTLLTKLDDNVHSCYEFYVKARERLAAAGLRLKKFVTNSEELRRQIQLNKHQLENGGV